MVRILLVEDNMNDAELTTRVLTKAGMANKLFHVKFFIPNNFRLHEHRIKIKTQ